MEAATPLRSPHVAVLLNRLIIDGLVVDDPTAAEVVDRRVEAGESAARVVTDAIEIGARVLEREQAGLEADFVRAEFEKVGREVEKVFTDQARGVADQLAAAFETHFSDGSSAAVQPPMIGAPSSPSGAPRTG